MRLPGQKANQESTDANRQMLLLVIDMSVQESRATTQMVRELASTLSAMADAREARENELLQQLEQHAHDMESTAKGLLRQRSRNVLTSAAAGIRKITTKLKAENKNALFKQKKES